MTDIIINVDPATEVRREHVCYYVNKNVHTGKLELIEVSEVFYQHPDGPALLQRIETLSIKTVDMNSGESPEILLLWNQQQVTRKLNSQT